MSLSKEERNFMVMGGAAALVALAAGVYAYVKTGSAAELEDPVEERLLSQLELPITSKTKFTENTLRCFSHDATLTQAQIIDSLNDQELLAKVQANTKTRFRQIKLGAEAQIKQYKPLIIVGPSGVGKGTLIDHLYKKYPGKFGFSVSYTTRAPREGEVHGKNYYYVSKDEFKKMIKEDQFVEWFEVHGNFYGTSKGTIREIQSKNRVPLLDIDIQGTEKFCKAFPETQTVFLLPPSLDILKIRLTQRQTDKPDQIQKRLDNALAEIQRGCKTPDPTSLIAYRVVNDDLKRTQNIFVRLVECLYQKELGLHMSRVPEAKMKFNQIFQSFDPSMRKTKVICTLGPACWSVEMLVKMLDAGMNVARLNFSHGDHKAHGQSVQNLRDALAQRPGLQCAVMLDTKGPEIRTGMLTNKTVTFKAGQKLKILTDYSVKGDETQIACSYKSLPKTVKVGSTVFVADGSLTCEVVEIKDDHVVVECKNSCTIGERKNMNLPGAIVDLPTLTEQDEKDLVDFGIKWNVDFIAASFVRKATDVQYIREILGPKGAHIKIISKIENQEGLHNYDAILEESDGIMVARGDLGMEIPPEKVFLAQKWMIQKANIAAKPVVTATQMLESMIKAPRPTRAEASDVANAVLDGTDSVMLSGESAGGDYPLQAVTIMAKICVEAEEQQNYEQLYNDIKERSESKVLSTKETMASSVCQAILDQKDTQLIIVLTQTGRLARLTAKYRPEVKILAASVNEHVVRQMNACRGVIGLKIPTFQGQDNVISSIIDTAKSMDLCREGGKVAVIHGINEDSPDESNIMKVLTV